MNAAAGTLRHGVASTTAPWRWLVVAITVVIVGNPAIFVMVGLAGDHPTTSPAAAIPVALAAVTIQLRHEFAFADGRRPRGGLITFLALVLLTYLPLPWFGGNWLSNLDMCVMASALMVFRGRWAAVVAAAPLVGFDVWILASASAYTGTYGVGGLIFAVFYSTTSMIAGAAALYGSARLLRLVDELHETRAQVAAAAVAGERLRISRDLHDLLGQSLSAISLKGDLAKRLLHRDPRSASHEVESVAELARDTLRGLQAVSRDEHAVSLETEAEGAMALLSATGIEAQVDIDLHDLAPALEHTLAWSLREGVANILRHSQARHCTITGGRRDHGVFLEMVNDGASGTLGSGTGLTGMHERASGLSGSVSISHTGGSFRLLLELPEEAG